MITEILSQKFRIVKRLFNFITNGPVVGSAFHVSIIINALPKAVSAVKPAGVFFPVNIDTLASVLSGNIKV